MIQLRNHLPGIQIGNLYFTVRILKESSTRAAVIFFAALLGACGIFPGNILAHMDMPKLFLRHVSAYSTVLVGFLGGGLYIPGMGLARILCTADGADMVVFIRICIFFQIIG